MGAESSRVREARGVAGSSQFDHRVSMVLVLVLVMVPVLVLVLVRVRVLDQVLVR